MATQKEQTEAEKEAAIQRFRRHAGAIDMGYPTGALQDVCHYSQFQKTMSNKTLNLTAIASTIISNQLGARARMFSNNFAKKLPTTRERRSKYLQNKGSLWPVGTTDGGEKNSEISVFGYSTLSVALKSCPWTSR